MTDTVELDFVFYWDKDSRHLHDGDFNKAGYLVDGSHVIHLQGNRLAQTNLQKLKRYSPKVVRVPMDAAVGAAVHLCLTAKPLDPRRFGCAMSALIAKEILNKSTDHAVAR